MSKNNTSSRDVEVLAVLYHDKRRVGRIIREHGYVILEKTGVRYLLERPPAVATDAEHVAQARSFDWSGFRAVMTDGTRYEARADVFDEKSFDLNRGHGDQLALTLGHWRKTPPGEEPGLSPWEPGPSAPSSSPSRPPARQLALAT